MNEKYLKYVSEIDLFPDCNDSCLNVSVRKMKQRNGSFLWAVYCNGSVLSTSGYFMYEPIPSNRDENFLKEARFESIEDSIKYFKKFLDNEESGYNKNIVKYWLDNFPKEL